MRFDLAGALGLAVGIVVLSASAPAAAQTDTAKAAANAKLAEARRLFDAGQFEASLQKLKLAFEILPNPKIQFSLGQAYRGLARYPEALDAFNRFLAETKDADPALRAEAKQLMADLKQQVSYVQVACDVPGAHVAIDGTFFGQTPLPGPLVVNPGPHEVVVRRPGSSTAFVEKIDPRRAAVVHLNARLAEQPAQAPPPSPAPAPIPAAAPAPAPPAATAVSSLPPPAATTPTREGWLAGRRWTWIAAGGAALFATGGAIAGLSMQQRYGELSDRCGVSSPTRLGCRESEIDSVATRQNVANTFWALTAAAAAAAGILFVIEGRGATVAPAATTSTVGVVGRVAF